MQTESFFKKYYDDALKISAICADLNLPTSDAKLFTYIHVKTLQNDGVEYFDNDTSHEIKALKILLGKTKLDSFKKLNKLSQQKPVFKHEKISDKLRGIEVAAKVNFGFEFPFKYELENRLKFHTDSAYRNVKVDFYVTTISPRIRFYEDSDVKRAFKNEQNRLKNISAKLSGLL